MSTMALLGVTLVKVSGRATVTASLPDEPEIWAALSETFAQNTASEVRGPCTKATVPAEAMLIMLTGTGLVIEQEVLP